MQKLNTLKLRVRLAELDKPKAWLAREIGISRQYMHHIIKCKKVNHIQKIASVLGIDAGDLVE